MKTAFYIFIIILFSSYLLKGQNYIEEKWSKYYEVVDNKIIGIWPHSTRYSSVERLKELRYIWGFNYFLFARDRNIGHFEMSLEAGFDSTKMMRQISQETYVENLQGLPEMWAYYIDEPADRGDNYSLWKIITDSIRIEYPNSEIVISGYKRNDALKDYVRGISDYVMFSSYKHWWEFLGLWISVPEDPDQRSDWADMKNLFGSKFAFTWIGAHRDEAEYDDLLGKAKNLSLSGVYLYQLQPHEDEVSDLNLEKFSDAASKHGYLDKYYQQVRDYYENGVFIKRKLLGQYYPSAIPDEYDHSILNFEDHIVTNNRIEDYFAEIQITAGGEFIYRIPPNKNSSFTSSNEIILKPGFHAEYGCEFTAGIESEN